MSRSRLTFLYVTRDAWVGLVRAFRQQGMPVGKWLVLLLLVIGLLFAFLAFVPLLSPFIYPLL